MQVSLLLRNVAAQDCSEPWQVDAKGSSGHSTQLLCCIDILLGSQIQLQRTHGNFCQNGGELRRPQLIEINVSSIISMYFFAHHSLTCTTSGSPVVCMQFNYTPPQGHWPPARGVVMWASLFFHATLREADRSDLWSFTTRSNGTLRERAWALRLFSMSEVL